MKSKVSVALSLILEVLWWAYWIGPALVRVDWSTVTTRFQNHWLRYNTVYFPITWYSRVGVPGQQMALCCMVIHWPRLLPDVAALSPRALSWWKGRKGVGEACFCLKISSHSIGWKSVYGHPYLQEGNIAYLSPSKKGRWFLVETTDPIPLLPKSTLPYLPVSAPFLTLAMWCIENFVMQGLTQSRDSHLLLLKSR